MEPRDNRNNEQGDSDSNQALSVFYQNKTTVLLYWELTQNKCPICAH